ncbi:MAG: SIS domain-containing protein [Chloroflexota bacterium]|nr:SIS domain-containing protein [Chloroflexota bacterium]
MTSIYQPSDFDNAQSRVLKECELALQAVNREAVLTYLNAIETAEQVFFVGVGRVMLSLQAVAKRYAHLGIRAVVVGQITEPAIRARDVLIVGSSSGETLFPVGIARKAKSLGATIIHIGSNPNSQLTDIEDLFIRIPVASRAHLPDEIESMQPMTSLFEQSLLLFGDITAMMMIQKRHLELEKLWEFHANLE